MKKTNFECFIWRLNRYKIFLKKNLSKRIKHVVFIIFHHFQKEVVKILIFLCVCIVLESHHALKTTLIDENKRKKDLFFLVFFMIMVKTLCATCTAIGDPCYTFEIGFKVIFGTINS